MSTVYMVVEQPETWKVGIYGGGGVYTEIAEAAAQRLVTGEPGRVLILAKRPDGTLIMQERAWTADDNEEAEDQPPRK